MTRDNQLKAICSPSLSRRRLGRLRRRSSARGRTLYSIYIIKINKIFDVFVQELKHVSLVRLLSHSKHQKQLDEEGNDDIDERSASKQNRRRKKLQRTCKRQKHKNRKARRGKGKRNREKLKRRGAHICSGLALSADADTQTHRRNLSEGYVSRAVRSHSVCGFFHPLTLSRRRALQSLFAEDLRPRACISLAGAMNMYDPPPARHFTLYSPITYGKDIKIIFLIHVLLSVFIFFRMAETSWRRRQCAVCQHNRTNTFRSRVAHFFPLPRERTKRSGE